MKRTIFVVRFLAGTVQAFANDWGMGQANSGIPPASIFRPVSTPAHEINTLAIFVLAVTTAIFVIVSGLLTYSVVRFRSRRGDDGSEPPQVYGSGPVEFAWTAVPVLIVFVLILTTARSVYTVQAARRPPDAIAVRVVGHQWWWHSSIRTLARVDEAAPPPALPDWWPVRRFGGYAAPADREPSSRTAAMRRTASVSGHARAGHVHDFTCFWGALGCACWAV